MTQAEVREEYLKIRSSMQHALADIEQRILLMDDPDKNNRINGLNNIIMNLVNLQLIHVGTSTSRFYDTAEMPVISSSKRRVQIQLDNHFITAWNEEFPDDPYQADVGITNDMRHDLDNQGYMEQHNVVPRFA
jgi:hypothetical protein